MVPSSALSPVIIITRRHPFNCSLLMTHHIGQTTFLGVLCLVVTAVHLPRHGPVSGFKLPKPNRNFSNLSPHLTGMGVCSPGPRPNLNVERKLSSGLTRGARANLNQPTTNPNFQLIYLFLVYLFGILAGRSPEPEKSVNFRKNSACQ